MGGGAAATAIKEMQSRFGAHFQEGCGGIMSIDVTAAARIPSENLRPERDSKAAGEGFLVFITQ